MKKVDYQRMIDTAMAFFLAGERCSPDLAFGNYPNHSVSAPMITNYAFSIELALKILLYKSGKNPRNSHNLRNLYDDLPDIHQTHMCFMEDVLSDMELDFVEWRYAFEHKLLVATPDSLRRSFIVSHREIRRSYPNLSSFYEAELGFPELDWNSYDDSSGFYQMTKIFSK